MSYIGKQPRKAALTSSDIEDGIITAAKIEDGAVVAAEIASNAVTTAKINADAVTGAKIADNAINSEHYTNGSIDTAHIAADQVVASLIADNAINSEHYTDGSIDTAHIAADQITNAKIADDQIDSEHYVDGSIDTAHIGDNQVTLAKMAGGTDGNIISFDASGDPVAIATGSDGQVLTSTGAGSAPAFEDAGGGEWTKLSHVTASNDATVVFNSSLITSTYQDYKVVYSNIHAASDRQIFNLRVSVDNGTNITNVDFVHRSFKPDGNVASLGESNEADFRLHGNETSGNAAGESLSGFIEIFDPSATDTRKHILGRTVFNLGDSGVVHFHSLLGGSTRVTNAVNYLRFNWASGNIASGEFTLYGRKI